MRGSDIWSKEWRVNTHQHPADQKIWAAFMKKTTTSLGFSSQDARFRLCRDLSGLKCSSNNRADVPDIWINVNVGLVLTACTKLEDVFEIQLNQARFGSSSTKHIVSRDSSQLFLLDNFNTEQTSTQTELTYKTEFLHAFI